MHNSKYKGFHSEEMILRDHLALERTMLANERTLLAYVRTTVNVIAVGATIIKLFEGLSYLVLGWFFVVLGIVIILMGLIRYTHIDIVLSRLVHEDKPTSISAWVLEIYHFFLRKFALAKASTHVKKFS